LRQSYTSDYWYTDRNIDNEKYGDESYSSRPATTRSNTYRTSYYRSPQTERNLKISPVKLLDSVNKKSGDKKNRNSKIPYFLQSARLGSSRNSNNSNNNQYSSEFCDSYLGLDFDFMRRSVGSINSPYFNSAKFTLYSN
jgi:hypothetical protein